MCRMQDQLIIFMALAQGTSRMSCGEPSLHTRTAMCTAEKTHHCKVQSQEAKGRCAALDHRVRRGRCDCTDSHGEVTH